MKLLNVDFNSLNFHLTTPLYGDVKFGDPLQNIIARFTVICEEAVRSHASSAIIPNYLFVNIMLLSVWCYCETD